MTDEPDHALAEDALVEAVTHDGLTLSDLHPVIRAAAAERWAQGDYAAAVRSSWFALRDLLRTRLGRSSLDGEPLVNAIGETGGQPALPLTDYSTTTEQNMHRGVVQMLRGIVFYARHPDAHESESPASTDRVGAFECLTIMSLCARYVANAATPTVVDDAIAELREPLFPNTTAALDDLVRSVPRRRFPEFIAALFDGAVAAYSDEDDKLCEKLHKTVGRALTAAKWEPALVGSVASKLSALISRDETLGVGIRLMIGPAFQELVPRYQEKVVAALKRLAEAKALDDETVLPDMQLFGAFDVLTRLPAESRNDIFERLVSTASSDVHEKQLWAAVILVRDREAWSDEQIETLARVIVETATRTESDRLYRMMRSIGAWPPGTGDSVRESFIGALRLQVGIESPGQQRLVETLAVFDAGSGEPAAIGPAAPDD